jgi:hypothetical protein
MERPHEEERSTVKNPRSAMSNFSDSQAQFKPFQQVTKAIFANSSPIEGKTRFFIHVKCAHDCGQSFDGHNSQSGGSAVNLAQGCPPLLS